MRATAEERFLAKVRVDEASGCWLWIRPRNEKGYARFYADRTLWYAHRWAYQHWVGPLIGGLVLDHYVCHNGGGGCVNPHHLRHEIMPINSGNNSNSRKTHCRNGHEFTPGNTLTGEGHRRCRECRRLRDRARWPERSRVRSAARKKGRNE